MTNRIYLDNAATSWPKPEAVYAAVEDYQRNLGAPAGRSAYRDAQQAERIVDGCRNELAKLLGVPQTRPIAFTLNGTDALNIAIHGTVRPGEHVVTTDAEHNSVLRPLRFLEETAGVQLTRVPCDARGEVNPEELLAAVRNDTTLVTLIHASNVTGMIQNVEQVAENLTDHPALLLVDAAQTLGHLSIDLTAVGADLVAAPGHKGLLGPLGTGVLYVGPRAEERLTSFRQGGTGTQSELDRHPHVLPQRCEAGNHNVPGIAGLRAAAAFLAGRGVASIHAQLTQLTGQLLDGLAVIDNVRILGPADAVRQAPLVSITIAGYDPQEVAAALDAGYGVQVRSGLHCAPRIHQCLGTLDAGGTVRFSPGPFNTQQDIETTIRAVAEIASAAKSS